MKYIWPEESEVDREMRMRLIALSEAVPDTERIRYLIHLALTSGFALPAVVDMAPKAHPLLGERVREQYALMRNTNLREPMIEFTDEEEAENRALRIRLGFERVLPEREHELPSVVTWKL